MRRLEEKHAVVTGAGAGIGRAITLHLAYEGPSRGPRAGQEHLASGDGFDDNPVRAEKSQESARNR